MHGCGNVTVLCWRPPSPPRGSIEAKRKQVSMCYKMDLYIYIPTVKIAHVQSIDPWTSSPLARRTTHTQSDHLKPHLTHTHSHLPHNHELQERQDISVSTQFHTSTVYVASETASQVHSVRPEARLWRAHLYFLLQDSDDGCACALRLICHTGIVSGCKTCPIPSHRTGRGRL